MIIPPRRGEALTDKGTPTTRFAEYLERMADDVNTASDDIDNLETDVDTLNAIGEEFSAINVTTTKSFDANTVTLAELADVVGSMIQRLQE